MASWADRMPSESPTRSRRQPGDNHSQRLIVSASLALLMGSPARPRFIKLLLIQRLPPGSGPPERSITRLAHNRKLIPIMPTAPHGDRFGFWYLSEVRQDFDMPHSVLHDLCLAISRITPHRRPTPQKKAVHHERTRKNLRHACLSR